MFHRWAAPLLVLALCSMTAKNAAGQETKPREQGAKGTLGRNSPNPFNPDTKIRFSVDCSGGSTSETHMVSMTRADDDRWMELALAEARAAATAGDVPVGAVIVRDNKVVAAAGNRTLRDQDPTAHAELIVIRQASAALSSCGG